MCLCLSANAQVKVTGKVVDAENGEGIMAAQVLVLPLREQVALTDVDGLFELEVEDFPVELEFSFLGYVPQVITADRRDIGTIELELGPGLSGDVPIALPSVTKVDTRLLQSANYQIIHQENIKEQSVVSIIPSLNQVPGIQAQTGALNTNRISIRGVGNRSQFTTAKIRAYLDDIPLTSGVGETTLEDIDLDLLGSVQVVKGPNVSNYGSGLGGSILMKSEGGEESGNFAGTSFTAGSFGLLRSSNTLNINSKKAEIIARYAYTHSDGYRENNRYDRHNFSLINRLDYSDQAAFTFLVNYTDLKAFIPSSLNEVDFNDDPSQAAFTWGNVKGFEDYTKLQVGASHHFGKGRFVNKTSMAGTFYDSYESRPFNILQEDSRAIAIRNKSNFYFDLMGRSHFFELGAEFFDEKYNWQTYKTFSGTLGEHLSDQMEKRCYLNAFLEMDWEFMDNLEIETGVNINHTSYDLTDYFFLDSVDISGDYRFKTIVSPRLGLNYYFNTIQTSLFANISHGFNAPTLEETLAPEGGINPDIQQEKGWSYEIGMRGRYPKHLNYDFSIYYMDIHDLLVAKRIAEDQYIGTNAGRTGHFGVELNTDYRIGIKEGHLTPYLNYHFAHYRFKEFIDGEDDHSGNPLTGTAPHRLNVGFRFEAFQRLYGHMNYQFTDAMPMRDDNSISSDPYHLMDIKLGYQHRFLEHWGVDVHAGIRNLWDTHYASMILINAGSFGGNAPRYYYPGLPRNYYGGVSLKYVW
jgi:iron complex outermembrane receptor protein